jgi:outer membrane lipoprotein SlyB
MMNLRKYATAGILTLSLVTLSYGGTITGSKTVVSATKTGTITGSRVGTITGSRVGTITGSSSATGTSSPAVRTGLADEILLRLMAVVFTIGW